MPCVRSTDVHGETAVLEGGAAGLRGKEGRILAEREDSPVERDGCAPFSSSLLQLLDGLCLQQATTLLLALEMKSNETCAHSLRVAAIALQIGREMGLPRQQLVYLKHGALLHDIGKLSVPDAILEKTERLTDEEWRRLRSHPWRGENLLASLDFPQAVCLAVGQHHECFDGTGYPLALTGEAISLEARIIAVADAYDTIRRGRCWRKGESYEVALHEVSSWSDRQFDPAVVDALVRIPKEKLENL